MEGEWIVISLGGSLISPEKVAGSYIKDFVELIQSEVSSGKKFAIIVGGGRIAREYRDALSLITNDSDTLDWMGIAATRYNAELLRLALGDTAESAIFLDPNTVSPQGNVIVGGGYVPGHSSDGSAVALAKKLGAKKLLNLSNIEYVYTADPKKDPSATPIEKISWTDFRKMLPEKWEPGLNAPFDPIAARMAEEIGLEVAVADGKNLSNLKNYFDGKEFVGTVIS